MNSLPAWWTFFCRIFENKHFILLGLTKKLCCAYNRRAIERSVKDDMHPFCTGNESLGCFWMNCGQMKGSKVLSNPVYTVHANAEILIIYFNQLALPSQPMTIRYFIS